MRPLSSLTAALVCALLLAPSLASAQEGSEDRRGPVPETEYEKWERIGQVALSPDGRRLAVTITRVGMDPELRIRLVDAPDSVIVVPNGGGAEFTDDNRHLLYQIGVGEDEGEAMRERGETVRTALGILDLTTDETTVVPAVASWSVSDDGRWVVMRQYAPEGEREARGVDIVVHDLHTGTRVPFGGVAEHAWQDDAPRLALLIDAQGKTGNGVILWDAPTGRIVPVHTGAARFSRLSWRPDSDDLGFYEEVDPSIESEEAWADTTWVVHVVRDAVSSSATHARLDSRTEGFPDGYGVAGWRDLTWSEHDPYLAIELRERLPAEVCAEGGESAIDEEDESARTESTEEDEGEPDSESECADDPDDELTVEIWHAADVDIVPTQKVRAGIDRRATELAVWHLEHDRVVKLEDDLTEEVTLVEGASHAVGTDATPWDHDRMFGPDYEDVYLVDLDTGEKRKVLERKEYFFGASTGGRYLFWFEDDHYWTWNVASGETVKITDGLDGVFVDLDDDHTVEQKPPFRYAGWLEDDAAVLLYDRHDLWRVAPDGSGGERVTRGAERNLRHRWTRIDPDRDFVSGPEPIDPDAEQWFALYDDWRETWGYGRAAGLGDEVEVLLLEEARITGLDRAKDADRWIWRVEDFEDSPDVFVGDRDLNGRQITRTNPFQDDYAWGTSELVEYVNAWGDTLQGALYYPAGYEPGRRYPMITYIYEIRSNTVRSYQVPSEEDYYDFQDWVQDGYFVFQPDIVYRDRDPGVSAVVNIVPAVRAVIDRGLVDPEAIGLIGHSWGGYQTTFFVTQSDLFAAAVAGAPLTNMFSMYLSIYWNTGGTDARIFEISQGRLEVPFWEDEAAYRRNSPVFHIEAMTTPLLMAQGTEDGAVDFNQGVEFYNAARRAGKDFVFLVYNDENHGFRKEPNRRDYHRRINEWFAHYLKGEPAPEWITGGVPWLEQPGGRR
ncbi:MAG: prolyl oligopeptidase family serine peptidase [Longimicrobiales bacterium]|nr:prolyl oligopeptidase family serine peptidase [Longimicrobiales bacterium]